MNAQRWVGRQLANLPPPGGQVAAALAAKPEVPWPQLDTLAFPKPAATVPEPKGELIRAPWSLPPQAAPVLVLALISRWQAYRQELRECQRHFSEPAVHELRVATRRFMAQLIMLSSVTQGAEAERARRLLKRRLKALGALRDAHVMRLQAQRETARYPELLLVRDFLERRERRLEKSVATKVKKFKTGKLEQWVSCLAQRLVRQSARARQPDFLRQAVIQAAAEAYREVVRRREAIDAAVPATIHRTRIAFKRFRYTLEALSPDFTGLQNSELRSLARYQRRMGNLQDLEVMQACVTRFVGRCPQAEPLLRAFSKSLQQRRRRALHSFLKSADELDRFWPPALDAQNGQALAALDAA